MAQEKWLRRFHHIALLCSRDRGSRLMRAVVGLLLVLVGCTSEPHHSAQQSGVGPACAWIGGTWQWVGCGEAKCVLYQDNCDVHMECTGTNGGDHTGAGSLAGNFFSFNVYCSATITGHALSGQCTAPVNCSFSATHP
jgi:hypothetical protein